MPAVTVNPELLQWAIDRSGKTVDELAGSFSKIEQWLDGELHERLLLPLSLSYDHRVINGADAARFIVRLSQQLADFFQLLVAC